MFTGTLRIKSTNQPKDSNLRGLLVVVEVGVGDGVVIGGSLRVVGVLVSDVGVGVGEGEAVWPLKEKT